MTKKKNDKRRKSSQKRTSKENNAKKNKNKWKSKLFKTLVWFISTFLVAVITVCVELGIPILPKYSSSLPPSLDTYGSSIRAASVFYDAEVPGDINANHYLAFQTDQTGYISIKLTNNDESTLVVNDIYLNLFDYQPITDIILSEGIWGGDYSNPVYYGVQLENICKEYRCTLLDKESAENFSAHYELPDKTNFKDKGEQIECNKTDEIEIIFSTLYPGIHRFKIVIDYSIRGFNDRIESDEFEFISLDPRFISQN